MDTVKTDEERFETIIRWMRENVEVGSGIYRSKGRELRVDPGLVLDADGNPYRARHAAIADEDGWMLNSAIALVTCCYMEALGKVLRQMEGKKAGRNRARFSRFVRDHLPGFKDEAKRKTTLFPSWKRAVERLYVTYRNGFAHQFAVGGATWTRGKPDGDYWSECTTPDGELVPVLHVARLTAGFLEGLERVRAQFGVEGGPSCSEFVAWLDKHDEVDTEDDEACDP